MTVCVWKGTAEFRARVQLCEVMGDLNWRGGKVRSRQWSLCGGKGETLKCWLKVTGWKMGRGEVRNLGATERECGKFYVRRGWGLTTVLQGQTGGLHGTKLNERVLLKCANEELACVYAWACTPMLVIEMQISQTVLIINEMLSFFVKPMLL